MDAAPSHPAYPAVKVIAHIGKVPILRLPLDSDFALVRGKIAADLFVAGRDKDMCSETIVDRTAATAAEKTDRGCLLLAKTLLETIDPDQYFAASMDSSGMRFVGCSCPHERLRFAHHSRLVLGFGLSLLESLVGLMLGCNPVDNPAATQPPLPRRAGLTYFLAAWNKDCNRQVMLQSDRKS